jgi:REP element-mobilizing transposase RayT
MPDHTHTLIGLKPNITLSDLVGDMKTGSTNHINENRWVLGRFCWQNGFGAFSYSHSQIGAVASYIRDKDKHHRKRTFREEYVEFLRKFAIAHEDRYIFEEVDEKR